jgi:hypothetical protein
MSPNATKMLLDALLMETIGDTPGPDDFAHPTAREIQEGADEMVKIFRDADLSYEGWVEWSQMDAMRTVEIITAGGRVVVDRDLALIMGTQLTQGFLMGVGFMKWKLEHGGAA